MMENSKNLEVIKAERDLDSEIGFDQAQKERDEEEARVLEAMASEMNKIRRELSDLDFKHAPTVEDYEEASRFIDEIIKEAGDESTTAKIGYAIARLSYLPINVLIILLAVTASLAGAPLVGNLLVEGSKKARFGLVDASKRLRILKKEAEKTRSA